MNRPFLVGLYFVWLFFIAGGCTSTVSTYRIDPNGKVTYLGTMTEDEYFKQLVCERIANELAGKRPEAGAENSESYWKSWYRNIRRHPKPYWKSKEFLTAEDLITFMKTEREAKNLPPFD